MAKPQLTVDSIANALEKTSGNVYMAAQALGVSRSAIYNKIKKHPELAEMLEDARETTVDIAESKLRQLVFDNNITAIIFTLKTIGAQRGYIERQRNDVTLQIDGLPDLLKAIEQAGLSPRDVIRALTDEIQSTLPKPD